LGSIQAYKAGSWEKAREIIKECASMKRSSTGEVIKDGPSQSLLCVIESYNGQAPPNWKGYRELKEK
jgi:hypothetical protein